ncbi:MAG: ribosome-associated translation inhibitor RaiA [Armatimonadetes bacterium]|nr:ribosome-associated translation inhibitor RaiA [Armatimonadota bacterium]
MNVIVQGRQIEVTEALKDYATRKVEKITKYFNHIQEAQVVLRVERRRSVGRAQVVEVTVWGDGLVLRGEEATGDMYASIDRVVEQLEKQIGKYRSRMIDKRRLDESRRRRRERAATAVEAEAPPAEPDIVRTKRIALKPMPPDEAVMQMELLGHDFFVFRNSQNNQVSVIYRRRGGGYGLIEPE